MRPRELAPGQFIKLRSSILKRDKYACQECGVQTSLEVHHIIPVHLNGPDTLDNLVTLCISCHADKHPDSHPRFHAAKQLGIIRQQRAVLGNLFDRFIAALYSQPNLPCDLWHGELIVFYPADRPPPMPLGLAMHLPEPTERCSQPRIFRESSRFSGAESFSSAPLATAYRHVPMTAEELQKAF